ncbi:hypothetical protein SLA2020_482930 [Shorea laevis]
MFDRLVIYGRMNGIRSLSFFVFNLRVSSSFKIMLISKLRNSLIKFSIFSLQASEKLNMTGVSGRVGRRMGMLLIPLELLYCISCTEFFYKKIILAVAKKAVQVLIMLLEGLFNHPAVVWRVWRKAVEMQVLLEKIEESEQ